MDMATDDERRLLPVQTEIRNLTAAMTWRVTRSHRFAERSHINLQEVGETSLELREICENCLTPGRHLNGTDSNVSLGAWAKGRSSSFQINGLERQ